MKIESPKGDPRWAFIAVEDLYKKIRSAKKFRALSSDARRLHDLVGELVNVAHEKFIRSTKPDVHTEAAGEGEHLLVGEVQLKNGSIIRAASDVDRDTIQVWVEETGYFSQEKQYSCVREFDGIGDAHEYMYSLHDLRPGNRATCHEKRLA